MKKYRLFYFPSCPFCQKVLRAVEGHVELELCNTKADANYAQELLRRGGKTQVPALDLGDSILYESDEITKYLL